MKANNFISITADSKGGNKTLLYLYPLVFLFIIILSPDISAVSNQDISSYIYGNPISISSLETSIYGTSTNPSLKGNITQNFYSINQTITTNLTVNTTQMSLVNNFLNILPTWLTSLFYTKDEVDLNFIKYTSQGNINFSGDLYSHDASFYFNTTSNNLNITGNITANNLISINGVSSTFTSICFVDLVGLTKKTQNFTYVGGILVSNTSCV